MNERTMNHMSTANEDIQMIARHSGTLSHALTQRFGRQVHYTRAQLEAVFADAVVPSTFHAYGIAMFAEPSERPGLLARIDSSKTALELRMWLIGDVFCYRMDGASFPEDVDFHHVVDSPGPSHDDSVEDYGSEPGYDLDDGEDGE